MGLFDADFATSPKLLLWHFAVCCKVMVWWEGKSYRLLFSMINSPVGARRYWINESTLCMTVLVFY